MSKIGYFPNNYQQLQDKVDQMLQLVQQGTGKACDAPTDDAVISLVLEKPAPRELGGTTRTLVETAGGDIYEHSQNGSILDGDKWTSYGKAPTLYY